MDIIEGLIGVVTLVVHWRILICLVFSTLAAFALVQLLPWATGLQGVVIAAAGLIPGAMWQARYDAKGQPAPPQITSRFVAGLSAVILGLVWGGASSASLSSAIAGAVLLVLALLTWHYDAVTLKSSMQQRRVMGCSIVATITYLLVVGLGPYAR